VLFQLDFLEMSWHGATELQQKYLVVKRKIHIITGHSKIHIITGHKVPEGE